MGSLDLTSAALAQARASLTAGDAAKAIEWLDTVPATARPADLEAAVCYQAAKASIQAGAWGQAVLRLERANAAASTPLHQQRLALLRQRQDSRLDNAQLENALAHTLRSDRLSPVRLRPEVDSVWALGAYISRGFQSGTPISRLVRLGKEELAEGEREGVAGVGGALLSYLLLNETDALARADLVVSIPANPHRYASRGWSLPDELARHVERHLALPFDFELLQSQAGEIELRGLSWSERRRAVRESMYVDDRPLDGLVILVLDDVITSGSTLREAGHLLKEHGAAEVLGASLTHTEG